MAPPVPIGAFIPPVTGFNKSLAPVANLFDSSNNFRQRTISLGKRRRGPDGDSLDNVFDLSREFPPLRTPAPLAIDTLGIKSLLVEAAKMETVVKMIIEKGDPNGESVGLAKSVVALYSLVEGLIEKAILPLCNGGGTGGLGGLNPSQSGRPGRPAVAPAPPLETDG